MSIGPATWIEETTEYHVKGANGSALCGADPGKTSMIDPSRRPRTNMTPVCAECAKREDIPQARVESAGATSWDELLDRF